MSIEMDLSRNIVTIASFYLQNNDFQTTLRFQYYRDDTLGHFKIEDQVCRETYLLLTYYSLWNSVDRIFLIHR